MIVKAGNGCYLTESYDTPIENRRFEKQVIVSSAEELSMWKEITETEKDKMIMQQQLFQVDNVDYAYLEKVGTLIGGIAAKVNDANLTDAQAIEMKGLFPKWEDEIGNKHYAGFKFQYGETLYKVLQPHTFAAEWVPGTGTESLYKVVHEDHEGTKDDPIPWEHNMELYSGKYYTDKGVLYLCIRDSGIALSYDLADLVSGGGYVQVVEEMEQPEEGSGEETTPEQPSEPDGTLESPIPYTPGKTELVKDKYYTEDGTTYLCIQDAGVQVYKLGEIPAIAQEV